MSQRTVKRKKSKKREKDDSERSTVLLVDDEPDSLALLMLLLESQNHNILTAENGVEAVGIAEKEDVDLVVMDVQMPEMDGITACSQIKTLAGDDFVPVILVTSLGDPMDRVEGISAGADDYIVKPYCSDEVVIKIDRYLRLKERFDGLLKKLEEATENEERLTKLLYEVN